MDLDVGEIGFFVCALAFGALLVRLRPGVTQGAPRTRLRLAALAMVAWSAAAWWMSRLEEPDPAWSQLLPICVISVWLWQLEPIAVWQGQPRWLQLLLRYAGVVTLAAVATWIALSIRATASTSEPIGRLPLPGLALGTFGLIALEQVYRNGNPTALPALRWFGLGIGGLLVTELVISAQVLLTHAEPTDIWQVRALIYALCAMAIARGARLMPDWSFGLAVSRRIVFYASSIVMLGAYLLLMSLVASIMVKYSRGWGLSARLGFAVLAALALCLSLFAGNMMRWLKVFISAHFYPQRYDYRAEWLRFTKTLSEEGPAFTVQQRAIRAIAQIVASPRGSLWRRDATGERFECAGHWPNDQQGAEVVPVEGALPEFLARTAWLVDLRELQTHPELYSGLTQESAPSAASDALIVPLLHVEQLYGWIVLDRPAGLGALNFEDRDLLKTAGRNAAAHLAQFDADSRLVQARQFETYNRMTAFVMHDLKNVAAQLRLISQNAERHRRNPEFVDDAFRTIASSVGRMTKLVSQLDSSTDGGTMQSVDLATAAERAAMRCSGQAPVPQVIAQARPIVFADLERLATIIEHAIRNAQDATPAHGEVKVQVGVDSGLPWLSVDDTGAGMGAAFIRERLFRPFDTTKGTRGMGIGAFQIREYITSLGGRIEVQSEPGRGTSLRLIFARAPAMSLAYGN